MTNLSPAVRADDHAQGAPNAPVTLVEYGDFECSCCGQAYVIVQQLQQEMGDQMRFVFRHFPLPEVHEHALAAADFAEAAGGQDAFWPVHDWLFTRQESLDPAGLASGARSLHLDAGEMKRDQTAAHHRVEADLASGASNGMESTPTFFINGTRFEGSWDYSTLLAAVQQAASRGGRAPRSLAAR